MCLSKGLQRRLLHRWELNLLSSASVQNANHAQVFPSSCFLSFSFLLHHNSYCSPECWLRCHQSPHWNSDIFIQHLSYFFLWQIISCSADRSRAILELSHATFSEEAGVVLFLSRREKESTCGIFLSRQTERLLHMSTSKISSSHSSLISERLMYLWDSGNLKDHAVMRVLRISKFCLSSVVKFFWLWVTELHFHC